MSSHSYPDMDFRLELKIPVWCGGMYVLLKPLPGPSCVSVGAPIDGAVLRRVLRRDQEVLRKENRGKKERGGMTNFSR